MPETEKHVKIITPLFFVGVLNKEVEIFNSTVQNVKAVDITYLTAYNSGILPKAISL